MGNTVGSTNADFSNLKFNKETSYISGLWCADGYHRTSSIGITNTDIDLVGKFLEFFKELFPEERIKLKIYLPIHSYPKTQVFSEVEASYLYSVKARHPAYQLYVNNRSLLRKFQGFKSNPKEFITRDLISPHMTGRFDGDGSIGKDFYRDCRIVYSSFEEAKNDLQLMRQVGFQKVKIYNYQSARTFCLYVSRLESNKLLSLIYPFSVRLQKSVFVPRRDLAIS